MKSKSFLKKVMPILGLVIFSLYTTHAQIVTGKVTDQNNHPLVGASVEIKNTSTGVATDDKGEFSIKASKGAILIFSFIGYVSKEITVTKENIDISLEHGIADTSLGEVVVIGYGTARKKDLTGSIVSVEGKKFETQNVSSITDMFRATVPGLNTSVGTSAKGNTDFEIRGAKSVGTGQTPLLVIDGMIYYGDITDINPRDIQTFDVLKDASSAAVYGARAANGVIIITTKKGTSTKPTISYMGSIGIATVGIAMKPRSPQGYLQMREDYKSGATPQNKPNYYTNPGRLPDSVSLDKWRGYDSPSTLSNDELWMTRNGFDSSEIQNYLAGKTVNWFDEVYKPGLRTNHDISISGKTDKMSYYTSLGYEDNTGMVVGDRFKTFRARVNLNVNVTKYFSFGTNTQFANRDESAMSADAGNIRYVSPYGNIYDSTGGLTWYPHNDGNAPNPLLGKDPRKKKKYINNNLLSNIYAELKLPFNIKYKVNWINRIANLQDYTFNPSTVPSGLPTGNGSREDSKARYWDVDNIISWDKTFAKIHRIDLTLLYSAEKTSNWLSHMDNVNFLPSQALGYDGLQYGSTPKLKVDDNVSTAASSMARLNYGLLDRYLLTVSVRRDGYSAFGVNNPWATFYATAFAWKISSEKFFRSDVINDLKLRLSWGQNGNREIGQYDALAQLSATKYIYTDPSSGNASPYTGVFTSSMANSTLQWEKTGAYNAGLNFGLFQNRVSGSVDAYYMRTTNMLMNRALPSIIGYSSVRANLGQVDNKGLEVMLNTINITKKDFKWTSSFVFSMNRNKIVHLYGNMVDAKNAAGEVIGRKEADDVSNGWFIGHALDQIYDKKIIGIWQSNEKDSIAKYAGYQPGDFKLLDVNGDYKFGAEDRIFQGYKKPRYRISWGNELYYKQFSLSFLFSSNLGYYGASNEHLHAGSYAYMLGRGNDYENPYWTPQNPNSKWARLGSNDGAGFSYWQNRSFVRLQNLSLGYEIPNNVLEKIKVQRCQVYLNMQNTLTFTKWDNWDPETGTATPRIYTCGVNLTL